MFYEDLNSEEKAYFDKVKTHLITSKTYHEIDEIDIFKYVISVIELLDIKNQVSNLPSRFYETARGMLVLHPLIPLLEKRIRLVNDLQKNIGIGSLFKVRLDRLKENNDIDNDLLFMVEE